MAIVTDKGTQLMEELLLSQYESSVNLKEYFSAFILEADFLFETVQRVYEERFLEAAVGSQLDVIGIILQQPRTVILPQLWFGFDGALDVDRMADEATPARGGTFRSEDIGTGVLTPLDDLVFRSLLKAKASIMNADSIDVNTIYHFISVLLNRVPQTFSMEDGPSGLRSVQLTISRDEVSGAEISLILYATKYFVPAGITFTINQV